MELSASLRPAAPRDVLGRYYSALLHRLGPQGWWPARTRFEVILGAILTQNTTWHNAALALKRLRKAGLLSLGRLRQVPLARVESAIRPAGFFRQKARTLRSFLDWLGIAHGSSLNSLFATPPATLRRELLELKGLGPETADAILLYAGRQPFFVADAYTRRILARHAQVPPDASYAAVQQFLHRHLPADTALFKEYHALLVEVGKRYCKRQAPRCDACPLQEFLPQGRAVAAVA
jgi:endonuclease-3 related protein